MFLYRPSNLFSFLFATNPRNVFIEHSKKTNSNEEKKCIITNQDGCPVTKDKVENSSERNELTSKKGQLPTSSDNNGQTARSSGSNGLPVISGDRNGQHVSSSDNRGQTATSSGASDGQTSSEATSDHSQDVLNYLNYADIKDIGCCVVDKLDEMRKNALGNYSFIHLKTKDYSNGKKIVKLFIRQLNSAHVAH